MARFKRLTDAEARSMTRRELAGRIEAEQAYWHRGHRAAHDPDGYREFSRIMHAYIDPAAAMGDLAAWIEGRGAGRYWDTRPGEPGPDPAALPPALAMDGGQRAALEYARRLAARPGPDSPETA